LTDQVAWLPGNERVDVINCEYGQPDYEERNNRRPVLDEDLIPEAIDAREASGRNSMILFMQTLTRTLISLPLGSR